VKSCYVAARVCFVIFEGFELGYRPRIPVETRCIAAAGVD
jgi:hypothetical protein